METQATHLIKKPHHKRMMGRSLVRSSGAHHYEAYLNQTAKLKGLDFRTKGDRLNSARRDVQKTFPQIDSDYPAKPENRSGKSIMRDYDHDEEAKRRHPRRAR